MIANSSQKLASVAPATSTSAVSGRVTNRVTTSPPAMQPKVTRNSSQASTVRVLGFTSSSLGGLRYGTVTAIAAAQVAMNTFLSSV
jgi:hypothetical protein